MDKRPKGRLPRLTDGFHLQDIGNAAKSAASLDKLRKFLESQKLIKCSHKARVPAHKAWVPRAQSLGLPGTKLGLGRRTKRVPSGPAPGWVHCAPSADQEQAILWAGGCPGVYCGYLWDLGTLRLCPNLEALLLATLWPNSTLPTKCSPMDCVEF